MSSPAPAGLRQRRRQARLRALHLFRLAAAASALPPAPSTLPSVIDTSGGGGAGVDRDPPGPLVHAAAAGDPQAWSELVDRFSGLVWAVARGHRLSAADAADVSQTTWLRLVENLGRLTDPDRVGAWLATTARRECLKTLRSHSREVLDDHSTLDLTVDPAPAPEEQLVDAEQLDQLWAGLDRLSDRCQQLLRVLVASPPPSYAEVSAALEMPIGSIGPTRARCLSALSAQLEADRS